MNQYDRDKAGNPDDMEELEAAAAIYDRLATECRIVRFEEQPIKDWCVTHNVEEDAGHAYATGRVATLD